METIVPAISDKDIPVFPFHLLPHCKRDPPQRYVSWHRASDQLIVKFVQKASKWQWSHAIIHTIQLINAFHSCDLYRRRPRVVVGRSLIDRRRWRHDLYSVDLWYRSLTVSLHSLFLFVIYTFIILHFEGMRYLYRKKPRTIAWLSHARDLTDV